MIRGRRRRELGSGERGASLVELLVATSIGLSLAALLAHTMTAYHAGYQRSVTRINGDQQAHVALTLLADEVGALLRAPASATCPAGGVRVADGRLEFAANLYDRSTTLRDAAPAGRRDIVAETGGAFEAGDLVMLVDVNEPADPGDDAAECARISDVSAGHWTLERALARPFPAGSSVTLVNRVAYALDRRGRLMRTQDGGTQRVAQDVAAFDVRMEGSSLALRLAMRDAAEWTRRVWWEDAR